MNTTSDMLRRRPPDAGDGRAAVTIADEVGLTLASAETR